MPRRKQIILVAKDAKNNTPAKPGTYHIYVGLVPATAFWDGKQWWTIDRTTPVKPTQFLEPVTLKRTKLPVTALYQIVD